MHIYHTTYLFPCMYAHLPHTCSCTYMHAYPSYTHTHHTHAHRHAHGTPPYIYTCVMYHPRTLSGDEIQNKKEQLLIFLCQKGATFSGPAGVSHVGVWGTR